MISEWFTDEELISQLEAFFTDNEREHINFYSYLGQIKMIDNETGEINIKNRVFQFNMKFCNVMEVFT